MKKHVAILGRQPALGLAELESLLGAKQVSSLSNIAAIIESEDVIPFEHIGGTTKLAHFIAELPFSDWGKIEDYLIRELPKHTCCVPPGKVLIGLNAYGFPVTSKRINATGLSLKKVVKNPPTGEGRSVRVVPNNSNELNAAQVIHNKLTGPTGFDLLLIRNGNQTVLAKTYQVQNIYDYAARDQKRPKRDARVGMLPPKLAQIIINLAIDRTKAKNEHLTVLDPFCGTGVVMQEALLMGYDAFGSDLEPRMIDYSEENLAWLQEKWPMANGRWQTAVGDATDFQWPDIDAIACETYLGRPFSAEPRPEILKQVMQDVDTIHRKFLLNVARQTSTGFRLCVAVPAWKTRKGFQHLKTLDKLPELGYTRVSFAHASSEEMIYHREGQAVARELVVLIRR